MKDIIIYTLIDPRDNQVRYVGKTNNIKRLIRNDYKPIIEILDEVDEAEWEFWEKYWICQFKAWGFDLVNATDGGITPFSTLKIRRKY